MVSHFKAAMLAWKKAKPGKNPNFMGYRVVKLPKVVLVMPKLEQWPSRRRKTHFSILAFPRPEHIGLFRTALKNVAYGSPGGQNPGSLGTIRFIAETRGDERFLTFFYVQYHFKVGSGHGLVPRKLATFYAGWRKHALREILTNAFRRKLRVIAPDYQLFHQAGKKTSQPRQVYHELVDLASELGATMQPHKFEGYDFHVIAL